MEKNITDCNYPPKKKNIAVDLLVVIFLLAFLSGGLLYIYYEVKNSVTKEIVIILNALVVENDDKIFSDKLEARETAIEVKKEFERIKNDIKELKRINNLK